MQINEQVASTVRAEMARNNVTQQKLADALNLSQAAVSRRLKGLVPFDVSELEIVARVVGRPLPYLVRPVAA
jgi:transcriptional regulator with XRE-family HTH domain